MKSIKLTKLLSMLMYDVDIVEYYNEDQRFLYRFDISEIPENCTDKIIKFNIFENEGTRILEVIEK